MRVWNWCLPAFSLSLVSAMLLAQAPPLGPEFQVNTHTPDYQGQPSVALDQAGNFVVAWASYGEDGSGYGVFGQRFDSTGARVGPEFQVNTYTTGFQRAPAIASAAGGSFVVVWESSGQDGSGLGVFGQRFDGTGAMVSKEFQVNTYTTNGQRFPAIASAGDGSFVVVWESYRQDGSDYGVFGQRFDSSGAMVGPDFQVNTYTTGPQRSPAIASASDGSFVVVWDNLGQGEVLGQRFDSSGVKVGREFQVNTPTIGFEGNPAIAFAGHGSFVVVWERSDGSFLGVSGQRFDSSGEKVGTEFQVNTYTTSDQTRPSVAADRAGNFMVAWSSYGKDGSDYGVFGQRFDRTGNPVGPEFPINIYTTGAQRSSKVVSDGLGFVVAWQSYGQDGSKFGVFGRRQDRLAVRLDVDSRSADGTVSNTNGVLEPGETVLVAPTWVNNGTADFGDFTGLASAFSGPPGDTYTIQDSSADYGPMPANSIASCDDGSPDACYRVMVAGPRPALHWDANLEEDVSFGGGQLWKLHIGDSFSDVPRSQPFYTKIETLLHNGITSGCGGTKYCPGSQVVRDQIAVFIAKGIAGTGELVPERGMLNGQPYSCFSGGVSRFSDVLPTDSFCKHVHYLAAQNVTLGCGNNQFCPAQTITRDAMASFIAKAIVAPGGGNAVPVTYGPDPSTGLSYSCNAGSPNIHFTDVPVSNPFCKHIHYLWAKGVVTGCSATQYCPTQSVNRDAMAKFISNAFNLQLYGP